MTRDPAQLKESPSQTAGPYVHIGCTPNFAELIEQYPSDLGACMMNAETKGERISITGRIFDGARAPLLDALVEIWQADANGLFNAPNETRGRADPNFTGWGRQPTDQQTGQYTFETIKPGPVPLQTGEVQNPYVNFWIVARGINLGLNTRMYFGDEDNTDDPVLSRLNVSDRVSTLIAPRQGNTYTFDIHLQGEHETIFFDI